MGLFFLLLQRFFGFGEYLLRLGYRYVFSLQFSYLSLDFTKFFFNFV